MFLDPIRDGASRAGRSLADLDLTVSVGVEFTDDVDAAGRRHAEGYAFTFGAMGSATTNFYNDAFARQGYGDDVRAVQQLWLAGDREAARRRVPTAIGLGTNLVGTDELIRDGSAATATPASPPSAPNSKATRPTTCSANSTTSPTSSTSSTTSTRNQPPPPSRPRRAHDHTIRTTAPAILAVVEHGTGATGDPRSDTQAVS